MSIYIYTYNNIILPDYFGLFWNVYKIDYELTSIKLTVLSWEAVASCLASGEKVTL